MTTTNVLPRLLDKYRTDVVPKLKEQFNYKNPMEMPRIMKVVVNVGLKEASEDVKILEQSIEEIRRITGQKPLTMLAKKSIAGFKLRQGSPVGLKVTLRGHRMYEFLDRLFNIAMPRIRDFRGYNPKSFDGNGNYTLGITEQTIFPEVEFDKVRLTKGMDITFVTSASKDEEARCLLEWMGLPFRKKNV